MKNLYSCCSIDFVKLHGEYATILFMNMFRAKSLSIACFLVCISCTVKSQDCSHQKISSMFQISSREKQIIWMNYLSNLSKQKSEGPIVIVHCIVMINNLFSMLEIVA